MKIRIYNETDNLEFYSPYEAERTKELTDLIVWAYGDLASKQVYEEETGNLCPKCGKQMIQYKGFKSCPDCGTSG